MEIRKRLTPVVTLAASPCPYCRASAERLVLLETRHFERLQSRVSYQTACVCGATGPSLPSPSEAAIAWREVSAPLASAASLGTSVQGQALRIG